MIRLDDLILVRKPHTAGTYATAVLRQLGGSPVRVLPNEKGVHGSHDPAAWLKPDNRAGTSIATLIVDPWTDYTRLYAMACHRGHAGPLAAWGAGLTDFRSCLYGWTHPTADRLPPGIGVVWALMGIGTTKRFLARGCGLATFGLRYIAARHDATAEWIADYFIDSAQVDVGLGALLDRNLEGVLPVRLGTRAQRTRELTPAQRARATRISGLDEFPEDAREWYDDDMIAWVLRADFEVIRAFSYDPFTPSPLPLWTRSGLRF